MIVNLDGSDFRDIRRSAQKQPDFRTVTMTCTTLRPGGGTCDGVGFKLSVAQNEARHFALRTSDCYGNHDNCKKTLLV